MRLVGVARQQGLLLTVADVFRNPKLEQMAKLLKNQEGPSEDAISSFKLLGAERDIERERQHAASLCGVSQDQIEDLFPCTPLQEGLLALNMKRQGDYVGRNVLNLSPSVDIDRFKGVWEEVVSKIPILRTRIIDLFGQGLTQAVIRGVASWTRATGLDDYMRKEKELPMVLGSPLMRCGLFLDLKHEASDRQSYCFAFTMHHSVYDGVTIPLILETLESLYNGKTPLRLCPFQSFIRYIGNQDKEAEAEFWRTQFEGVEAPQFPTLPFVTFQPKADSTLTYSMDNVAWRLDDFPPSTAIRAAWAVTCSRYTNVSDVVFGTIVVGRKVPIGGTERVAGPTISAVPIRIKVDGNKAIDQLLQSVQTQATEMVQYEHTGLSKIRQVSDEAQYACRFQTMLVVQPPEKGMRDGTLFVSDARYSAPKSKGSRFNDFNVYGLMVVCTLEASRLHIEFSFDSRMIEYDTVHRMAQHFEQVLKKLCSQHINDSRVCDVNMMTDSDLAQIWTWNSEAPETLARCVHDLISEVARKQPNSTAVVAWDGELSYEHLDRLSTVVACRLADIGVEQNTIVPLCFEKSVWMPVAFLSVVKAGGAGLLLDPTLPRLRLEAILQQVHPKVILSSIANRELSSKLVANTMVLSCQLEQLHHKYI